MKLISIRAAKAIWLIPVVNLNPRGRFLIPAVGGIMARYQFAKGPDISGLLATPAKIEFESGAFTGTDGHPVAVDLTVHDDGIVVETRSTTADGDLFLEDLLSWLSKEYDLPSYTELGIRKMHGSEVVVKFDKALSVFTEKVQAFSDSLSSTLARNQQAPVTLANLNFALETGNNTQMVLRIEREAGVPFGENRFYSYAPIPTEEHLRLLERFESSLG